MTERRTQQKVTVLMDASCFVTQGRASLVGGCGDANATIIAIEAVPVPMSDAEERDALVEVLRDPSGVVPIHPESGLARRIRDAGLAHLFPEVTK